MPNRRVLIASGERYIVRLVEVNLQRAGYHVMTAHDGYEALEKIKLEKPEVVVLDVMLRYVDGFAILKNLKSDPDTVHIPVVMLMEKAQDADVISGWQSGVDCYLTKPFGLQELLEFLKRFFH